MMRSLKPIVRKIPGITFVHNYIVTKYIAFKLRSQSTEDVFSDIYRGNKFGGKDSVSGGGSDFHQTQVVSEALPPLFDEFKISTVLDIPCGDFYWMKGVDLKGINYMGADIVKELIQKNREYERENVCFRNLNLLSDNIPIMDLVFCRDCLVHFSFDDIFQALHNICNSQSEFLLTTTFTERKVNCDILTGQWRTINLEVAPFCFPKPLMIINEECTERNGLYKDKSLALWRTKDIQESLTKQGSERFTASNLGLI